MLTAYRDETAADCDIVAGMADSREQSMIPSCFLAAR